MFEVEAGGPARRRPAPNEKKKSSPIVGKPTRKPPARLRSAAAERGGERGPHAPRPQDRPPPHAPPVSEAAHPPNSGERRRERAQRDQVSGLRLHGRASPPFELGLALLKECADALVLVLARKAEREQINLTAQALVEVRARGGLDGLLRHAQRDGALLCDAVRELHRLRFEVCGGGDYIYESEGGGRLRGKHLARGDELHRPSPSPQPPETVRP